MEDIGDLDHSNNSNSSRGRKRRLECSGISPNETRSTASVVSDPLPLTFVSKKRKTNRCFLSFAGFRRQDSSGQTLFQAIRQKRGFGYIRFGRSRSLDNTSSDQESSGDTASLEPSVRFEPRASPPSPVAAPTTMATTDSAWIFPDLQEPRHAANEDTPGPSVDHVKDSSGSDGELPDQEERDDSVAMTTKTKTAHSHYDSFDDEGMSTEELQGEDLGFLLVVEDEKSSIEEESSNVMPPDDTTDRAVAEFKESDEEYCATLRAQRTCVSCIESPATVWCCECARCLCDSCDERFHDSNALDALRRPMCSHRVEQIVDGGGLPILSPLLEVAVLLAAVTALKPLWDGAGKLLNVEYFFESVCPVVQSVRRWVFQLDHAVYPLIRGTLGEWCDKEDAFIKIFVDLWVRGILTATDSFALLLMKIPSMISALVVVLAMTPIIAIPYAIVATLVRWVEVHMFPNRPIFYVLARFIRLACSAIWLPCRIAGWMCRSTVFGIFVDGDFREHFHRRVKIPPKTGRRTRPTPSDGMEDISVGGLTRITRIFWYFHRKAQRAIISTIMTAVFFAVSIRVALLSLPRCGGGILSVQSDAQSRDIDRAGMWNAFSSTTNPGMMEFMPTEAPICVHVWFRTLARKLGVEIPTIESLGDEGSVLMRMQDTTSNDYLDASLRKITRGITNQFLNLPLWLKSMLGVSMAVVCLAGIFRRMVFWADLQRRYKYRNLRQRLMGQLDEETAATAATTTETIGKEEASSEMLLHPKASMPRLMKQHLSVVSPS